MFKKYISFNTEETFNIGKEIGSEIKIGDNILLYGELGTGKTELIKGISNYFNTDSLVNSPTFTIVNQYFGNISDKEILIYHIDLYRIRSAEELIEFGFYEILNDENSIKLIEWPQIAEKFIKKINIKINIEIDLEYESKRKILVNFS